GSVGRIGAPPAIRCASATWRCFAASWYWVTSFCCWARCSRDTDSNLTGGGRTAGFRPAWPASAARFVTCVLLTCVNGATTLTFCKLVMLMLLLTTVFATLLVVMLLTTCVCCTRVCGGRGMSPRRRPTYRLTSERSQRSPAKVCR